MAHRAIGMALAPARPPWYSRGMDIDIPLFRTTGRASKAVSAEIVRSLDEADLALLGEEKGSKPSAIKRISERHHALARNLAAGMGPGEAALVCGYSASRVSILQDDPAFKELVIFYSADVDRAYADLHTRLSGLAVTAADELMSRLEDDPEGISTGQLMELTKMGADRTGHGPQSSSTNVNVNVDLADRLKAARERVAKRTIEG